MAHEGEEPVIGPGPEHQDLFGQRQPGLGVAGSELDVVQ